MSPILHLGKWCACFGLLATIAVDTPPEVARTTAEKATQAGESRALRDRVDALSAETKLLHDVNANLKMDLIASRARIVELENKLAQNKAAQAKAAPGTQLKGKRVVFLVDISGSMTKLNENTDNPDKWRDVCDAVAMVMGTFPDMEQYQVIVFSNTSKWLFGNGEWQPFDAKTSPVRVKTELLKIKPTNDTNLHDAFDLAFGLRKQGLDAIFLFSDGLPTSGPGMTAAEQANPNLTEEQRGAILGRHVREQLRLKWNAPQPGAYRVQIHAIGIYFETSNVGSFLWTLTRDNDGLFIGLNRP